MRPNKFLVDSMLGKLARFLRIFGFDTIYAHDLENDYGIAPIPDNILLEHALKTERTLITRDLSFFKKAKDHIIYVEGDSVYAYMKQLKEKLNLIYDYEASKARCSLCNSQLKLVEDLHTIKDKVKVQTLEYVKDFYQCENQFCGKVFWNASHIQDILHKLRIKGILESD